MTGGPTIVACGGVDSSGGAGLDADRDAAALLDVELLAVATCHTEQDARGVYGVREVDPAAWSARVSLDADALKLGLLPGAAHVRAAAAVVRAAVDAGRPAVVDPVVAASSGHVFLDAAALEAFRGELLPAGPILTPNLPEAAALAGLAGPLDSSASREAAARALLDLGATAVVLTGGHGPEPEVHDLLLLPDAAPRWHAHPRLSGTLRGTGCRFATALAVHLARGEPLERAVERAGELVVRRLAGA